MNELKSLLNKVAAEKRDAFELGKYAYVDLLAEIEVALRQQDELDAQRQRVAELEAAQRWVPVKTAHYQDGQGIVIMTFHEQTINLLIRGHGLVHVALRGDHRLCASEGGE